MVSIIVVFWFITVELKLFDVVTSFGLKLVSDFDIVVLFGLSVLVLLLLDEFKELLNVVCSKELVAELLEVVCSIVVADKLIGVVCTVVVVVELLEVVVCSEVVSWVEVKVVVELLDVVCSKVVVDELLDVVCSVVVEIGVELLDVARSVLVVSEPEIVVVDVGIKSTSFKVVLFWVFIHCDWKNKKIINILKKIILYLTII